MKTRFALLLIFSIAFLPPCFGQNDFWRRIRGTYPSFVQTMFSSGTGILLVGVHSDGLYYTTDAGNYWTQTRPLGMGAFGPMTSITLSKNGNVFVGLGNAIIFRTTFGQTDWIQTMQGLELPAYIRSLLSTKTGKIFAGSGVTGEPFWSGRVYVSSDEGESWQTSYVIPSNAAARTLLEDSLGAIYVGTEGLGIFKTTDEGITWLEASEGLSNLSVTALSYSTKGLLFAGTEGSGIFKSIDYGFSWKSSNNGLNGLFVRSIAVDSSGNIFAGTINGLFRSYDDGESWQYIDIYSSNIEVTAVTCNTSGDIWAAVYQVGVFHSTDHGNSWELEDIGMTKTDIKSVVENKYGHLFAATSTQGIFRTTDTGDQYIEFAANWTQINKGLKSVHINKIIIDPDGWLFCSTTDSGLFYSIDNGSSWNYINSFKRRDITSLFSIQPLSLIIGTSTGEVFISEDKGNNWIQVIPDDICNSNLLINCGLGGNIVLYNCNTIYGFSVENHRFSKLASCPSNIVGTTLLQLSSGKLLLGTSSAGIYSKYPLEDKWSQNPINTPFGIVSLLSEGVLGGAVAGIIDKGVYVSSDDGYSWYARNKGLTNFDIESMFINSVGITTIGTKRGGLFHSNRSIETSISIISPHAVQGATMIWEPALEFDKRYEIQWKSNYVDLVDIYLINMDGTLYQTILKNFPSSFFKYNCDVQALPNRYYRIVVNDAFDYTISDTSDPFIIYRPRGAVQIKASAGSFCDNQSFCGFIEGASNGFDTFCDIPKPSEPPGNFVHLYFPHQGWIEFDKFASDYRHYRNLADSVTTWDFEVHTNIANQLVNLNFNPDEILPAWYGASLTDLESGTKCYIRKYYPFQYQYQSGTSGGTRHFRISLGDSTKPTISILSPQGGEVFQRNQPIHIKWDVSDGSGIDSIFIFYSENGGVKYQKVVSLGDTNSFNWDISSLTISNQMMLIVSAYDCVGNDGADTTLQFFSITPDSLAHNIIAGWNLLSLPLDPTDHRATSIVGDNISGQFWTFDYLQTSGYRMIDSLQNGYGFWLGTLTNSTIDVKGNAIIDSLILPLPLGFSIIGNPFISAMTKNNIGFINNGIIKNWQNTVNTGWVSDFLFCYDSSGYKVADTLDIWNGYWIGTLMDNLSIIFRLGNQAQTPQNLKAKGNKDQENWLVHLNATTERTEDLLPVLGIQSDATDGFDPKYDIPAPPLPPGGRSISLYFPHPEWQTPLGSNFSGDIRSIDGIKAWNFELVSTEAGKQVVLKWITENLPSNLELFLTDLTTQESVNMNRTNEYQFIYNGKRSFQVYSKAVSVENENKDIPTHFSLSQKYPNPFNPITNFEYAIPKKSLVRIEIIDIQGRVIQTLVNQTKEPGYYRISWDTSVHPSGVYFYRLQAGDFQEVRKCLIVK